MKTVAVSVPIVVPSDNGESSYAKLKYKTSSETLQVTSIAIPRRIKQTAEVKVQPSVPAGVIVEVLLPSSDKRIRVARTGANGQFRFTVPPGSYVLQFSLLGFDRVRQPVQTDKSRGERFEVGLPLGT